MELNKKTYLRRHLEQLPTAELEALLQGELQSEEPEEELVRYILQILEERHQQDPGELQINSNPAWAKYKAGLTERKEQQKKSKRKGLQAVAAIAAIFVLVIFVLPQAANANNIVELIEKWSNSFIAFFNQSDIVQAEYVFKTDNPGLQQVYDAVVEMGITDPVVPMWLEDGYELTEIRRLTTPVKDKLHAIMKKNDSEVIFTATVYSTETTYKIYKEGIDPEKHETCGVIHYISENNGLLVASWKRENIICSLSVDCREETLYKILDSIYTTEVS